MARITVEDCLDQIGNRFTLCLVAAERTKQLMKGSRVTVDDDRSNKEIVTALREIAKGSIKPDLGAFDANEHLAKERAERAAARGQATVDDLLPPAADDLPPEA